MREERRGPLLGNELSRRFLDRTARDTAVSVPHPRRPQNDRSRCKSAAPMKSMAWPARFPQTLYPVFHVFAARLGSQRFFSCMAATNPP